MSVKALNQAFETKLNGNLKLVLLALADSADDNMQCFPSFEHIAKKASVSRSTAIRTIEKLEKIKALKKQNRYKKNKKENTSNLYTLTIGSINMTLHENDQIDTTSGSTTMTLASSTSDTTGGITAMTLKPSSLNHQLTSLVDEREIFTNFNDFRDFCIKNKNKISFQLPYPFENLQKGTIVEISEIGYLKNKTIDKLFQKDKSLKIWSYMFEKQEKIIKMIKG